MPPRTDLANHVYYETSTIDENVGDIFIHNDNMYIAVDADTIDVGVITPVNIANGIASHKYTIFHTSGKFVENDNYVIEETPQNVIDEWKTLIE